MSQQIPVLDHKNIDHMSEGRIDKDIYHEASGDMNIAVVFVDFPDKKADISTEEAEKLALKGSSVSDFFKEQSYGKLNMKFESFHKKSWPQMPDKQDSYNPYDTDTHRHFIEDALRLYPTVDFTKFHHTLIITPPGSGCCAFSEKPKISINTKDGKINTAITLSYSNNERFHMVTCHELGHLLGLPDVYTYKDQDLKLSHPLGSWDIMSLVRSSNSFIAWHRHLLGWLEDDRKVCMTSGTQEFVLHPVSSKEGLAMIVVPVGDVKKPTQAFVIEIASKHEVKIKHKMRKGILIYRIDATVPSGKNPVIVFPKTKGKNLSNAPYRVGQTFDSRNSPVKVKVLEKLGDTYRVRIKVK